LLGVHRVLEFDDVTLLTLVVETFRTEDSEHDGLELLQLVYIRVIDAVLYIVLEVE